MSTLKVQYSKIPIDTIQPPKRLKAQNRRICFQPLIILVAAVCSLSASTHSAAQTFNEASTAELSSICNAGVPSTPVGSQLQSICQEIAHGNNASPAASAGIGTQSQPNSALINQQQLKTAQTKAERKLIGGASGDSTVSANWSKDFSTFLTAGATSLRHRQNRFEDGYDSNIPSVTLGADYQATNKLLAGLAFNYTNWNGSYSSGGGFDANAYTPLFYLNYQPFKGAFANLILSYSRQNQSNNRITVVTSTSPLANPPIVIRNPRGDFSTDQYNLNFLSGYDHQIGNLAIGPRIGVDARHWHMASYQESSNTGLELAYNEQNQTSIQTKLGIAASYLHRYSFGAVVPYASVYWAHEFENDERLITARFVQAPESNSFSFQTETPARNWAVIDVGVSAVMKENIQAFVNFSMIQGNKNFDSYGGTVGIKTSW